MDATPSHYKFNKVKKPHFASFLTLFCYEAKNLIRKKPLYRIKIRNMNKTYKGITTLILTTLILMRLQKLEGKKISQEGARVLIVSSALLKFLL